MHSANVLMLKSSKLMLKMPLIRRLTALFSARTARSWFYPPGRQTESYTIPDSVTKIRSSAFAYNSYITEIKFPDSTVEAEDYAFYFCDRLRNADFGNGLKKSEIMHFTVQIRI